VLIVADDLTGAADTAGAFATAGHRCVVVLDRSAPSFVPNSTVVALDTDTRSLVEADAFDVTSAAVRGYPGRTLYLKIDSTARGHIRATVLAALSALAGTADSPQRVVVCPAFPALGRTVVGGIAMLDRKPVANGDLCALLADVSSATELIVADARTDADLAELVQGWHDPLRPTATLWVGSAGLARRLADHIAPIIAPLVATTIGEIDPAHRPPSHRVMVVVGSQHGRADAQVARVRADTRLVRIDPREPSHIDEILPMLRDADGLVLTGGHTAHVVLDALGVSWFAVCGEVETGMPWATAISSGRLLSIVTKAGGFGNEMSLRRAVEFLEQP
jgi:D-threonate/D-erythronate kinase